MNKNIKKRIYTSLILFFLFFLTFNSNFIMTYSLIVLGALSIIEFLNITNKIFKNKIYLFTSNFFFIFFVFVYCLMFFFFSHYFQLKIVLFSLLLGCIASDIGGFIFGKLFKGPKLTKISPNKTIAGALGSIFLASLVISFSIFYFTHNYTYMILITCIITSITCQIGDLFFSFLKRKARIKNTGNFLPGHGGILDRLDGIFLGLPCGFLALTLIH